MPVIMKLQPPATPPATARHGTHASVGFVALSFAVTPGSSEVQLLPTGAFRTADGSGRPTDIEGGKPWFIDAAVAAQVIARANAQVNRFVIDYEHQTLLSEKNGQPAPGAGWFKQLEWRDGTGLFATDVEWTARAKAYIDSREYLYISSVFFYSKVTGEVLAMRMAALTNAPGLDGMSPVAALTASLSGGGDVSWIDPITPVTPTTNIPPTKETTMDLLKKLLAALGLPDTTTEDTALTSVAALKSQADSAKTELAALKAQPPAGNAGTVDLTKYVPVSVVDGLRADMAALSANFGGSDGGVSDAIDAAKAAGKVWPSEVDYLKQLGKTSGLAVLKSQLDARPVIPALAGMQSSVALTQQHQQSQASAPGQITPEGLAVCKQLGLSPDEWLKASVAKG